MSDSPCSENSNVSSVRMNTSCDTDKSDSLNSTKLEIDLSVNKEDVSEKQMSRNEFTCGICQLKFSSFESLDEHYVESHNHRVEHICPKCNAGYHIIHDYYQHKSSHSEGRRVSFQEDEKKEDEEEEVKTEIKEESEEAPKTSKAKKRKSEISLSLFKKPKKEKVEPKEKKEKVEPKKEKKAKATPRKEKAAPVEPTADLESEVFTCDVCKEENLSGTDFVEHCKTMHNRTPCLHCGQTFAQKSFLERHSWKHKGVKPFPCKECPKAFTRKHALDNHILKNHPTAGSQPEDQGEKDEPEDQGEQEEHEEAEEQEEPEME